MYTLGIETSCDETACAVLKGAGEILSNVISSSLVRHKPFGGVVPEIASRHCLEAIDVVYEEALREAGVKQNQIDLISVTQGPGLIGSIFVGVSFAKALSFSLDIPLIGVNHIEAHLEANFIGRIKPSAFIGLIVSGGHTALVKNLRGRYKLLGETEDDAIGEAYDKVAKILELGYPGGPTIDRLAQKGNPKAFSFTKPKQDGRFNFSFSGIKTAVLNLVETGQRTSKPDRNLPSPLRGGRLGRGGVKPPIFILPHTAEQCRGAAYAASAGKGGGESTHDSSGRIKGAIIDLCASFQESVTQWVVEKTILACDTEKIHNIVVGGGVSANSRLRELLTEESRLRGLHLFLPPLGLTTDNAVMIARLGYELFRRGRRSDFRLIADPSLKIGGKTNGFLKHGR